MYGGVIYCKLQVNVNDSASLRAKIAEIDALINELFNTAMRAVTNGDTAEYELDTGQTKVKKKFTTAGSVAAMIEDYEKLKIMYENKLYKTTGVFQLRDKTNFRR